jgi:hypothetical protein
MAYLGAALMLDKVLIRSVPAPEAIKFREFARLYPNQSESDHGLAVQRLDFCHGTGLQGLQQLGSGLSQYRMHPTRRDFRKRHQHKPPILQARMRQDQAFGRKSGLIAWGQVVPMAICLGIRQNQIIIRQQIQIQRATSPTRNSRAAMTGLDRVQSLQDRIG